MARNWNPRTHPYRVRKIRMGGPHGWSDRCNTYATIEEAEAAMNEKMTGGEYEVELEKTRFDDAGNWNGWIMVAKRKINQKAVWVKPKSVNS